MPVLEVLYSGPGPGCHAWDEDPDRWILSGMTVDGTGSPVHAQSQGEEEKEFHP